MTVHTSGDEKLPLLVLVGPTAIGKTSLSLTLAKAWNAEIISGDSMQVYRGMDIGTAKLPLEDREGVPHHLIDICPPTHPFSVAEFQAHCRRLIPEIAGRGRLPFLVGGTGLYVESVCYDYQFSDKGSDEHFRMQMQQLADTDGAEALHARLAAVDAVTAQRLHPNDVRRVIRALEVQHLTGIPLSEQLAVAQRASPYRLCIIGLAMERARLYARVEQRIDEMLEEGLLAEVQGLLEQGVPRNSIAMQGLGYKEMIRHLDGELTFDAAVTLLKRDTRHFAKRQLSWFRHMKEIQWIDAGSSQNFHECLPQIHAIIAGKFQDKLE